MSGVLGTRRRATDARRSRRASSPPPRTATSQGLEELLAHDVVFRGDGGGKAPAAARAVHGRAKVARLLIAGMRTLAGVGGVTMRREEVNGQPGVLFLDRDERLIGVTILDIADGQIQGVSAIVNPDKLRHLGPVGDVRALLRRRR